jgi:hypothetical protein
VKYLYTAPDKVAWSRKKWKDVAITPGEVVGNEIDPEEGYICGR